MVPLPVYTTLEAFASAPALPSAAIADFRSFAASRGDSIASDSAADRAVSRLLALAVAGNRWGEAGYYRIAAALDPDVAAASRAFDHAAGMLGAH